MVTETIIEIIAAIPIITAIFLIFMVVYFSDCIFKIIFTLLIIIAFSHSYIKDVNKEIKIDIQCSKVKEY